MTTENNTFKSLNPSDGSTVWEGSASTREEVDQAVNSAQRSFKNWQGFSIESRIEILRRFATVLETRNSQLATIISKEIGKSFAESQAEVKAMAGKVEISIQAHHKRCAEFSSGPAVTRFKPHGILAVLGPYNFPGHLPNGHIVPALLAGNTVIFKPSEQAPAVADFTFDCWKEAGLPEGVLHVIQGGTSTAKLVAAHPGIDGLLFTGSATTGKILARQFAETPGKILALEMGGNNPLIVDSGNIKDIDNAVSICLNSAFLSTGQRCTCARRLIVVDSPKSDTFLASLVSGAQALVIDDPFANPPPFMGPLASAGFAESLIKAQDDLVSMGANPLLRASHLQPGTGFVSPGILEVSSIENPPDEEIFGPILQVYKVPDLPSAIKRANATRFGLAAGFIGDDEARYRDSFPQLRAGIINWNVQLTGASSAAPFGGIGDSGNLRPAAYFAADYCSYPVASMEKP